MGPRHFVALTSGCCRRPSRSVPQTQNTERQTAGLGGRYKRHRRDNFAGKKMKHYFAALLLMLVASGCKIPGQNNLPPSAQLMEPGPGVGGPGPGVLTPEYVPPFPIAASQVAFVGPDGMYVTWDVTSPGAFDSEPLVVPGRYNFGQGALYRLKLTNIPGRPGVELYPTIEIAPTLPRTDAFLAHNAIPVQFTEEDLDQVLSGNFVTKVIYLPDPEFQELAVGGIGTLVSTRLDPGVDPIVEADEMGAILAIVRLGNKDLQMVGGGGEMVGGFGGTGFGGGGGGPGMGDGCAGCGGGGGMGPGGIGPAAAAYGPSQLPGMVAGATAPEWGMPISGTPIGLPGPPHVPLGVPAGLQKHVIKNHTHYHIPDPVRKVRIDVKQSPGISYPKPPSHVSIHERATVPPVLFKQPISDKTDFLH